MKKINQMSQEEKLNELSKFKKSNKERRQKVANAAGYKTVEGYLKALGFSGKMNKSVTNKVKTIPTIHIVNIVDASGSMSGGKIKAANEAVQKDIRMILETKDVNYTYTLVSFSDNNDINTHLFLNTPASIGKVENFRTRGMTALYDAVSTTLVRVKEKVSKNDKVVVTIITDGEENDSRLYNQLKTKNIIVLAAANGNESLLLISALWCMVKSRHRQRTLRKQFSERSCWNVMHSIKHLISSLRIVFMWKHTSEYSGPARLSTEGLGILIL